MKAYSDNKETYGYYSYDDAGQRMYKVTLNNTLSRINALGDNVLEVEKLMLYPNGYININQDGNYTKHYYAEDARIASKIGSGFRDSISGSEVDNDDALELMQEELGLVTYDTVGIINYSFGQITHLQGDSCKFEEGLYFYHGNHLSSTQLITDMYGSVNQAVLYGPWGNIISEYRQDWMLDTIPRYLFNAKEKDEESGLYYYEARYYSDEDIVFRGRDPMFEKYPSISFYAYCNNNPLKYIDPTGRDVEIICPNTGDKIKYTPGMAVPDGASKFMSDAITGLNYLHDNPEGDLNRVGELVNSEVITTIMQQNSNESSKYSGANNILRFENTMIDDFGNGLQSPIIGLAHELDHAYISVKAWESVWAFEANGTPSTNIDYMNSVETAYMLPESSKQGQWEASAMKYENFIGTKTYNGQPISTYQRQQYIAPINRYPTNSIFSITR